MPKWICEISASGWFYSKDVLAPFQYLVHQYTCTHPLHFSLLRAVIFQYRTVTAVWLRTCRLFARISSDGVAIIFVSAAYIVCCVIWEGVWGRGCCQSGGLGGWVVLPVRHTDTDLYTSLFVWLPSFCLSFILLLPLIIHVWDLFLSVYEPCFSALLSVDKEIN
jgi:hypothetical protein